MTSRGDWDDDDAHSASSAVAMDVSGGEDSDDMRSESDSDEGNFHSDGSGSEGSESGSEDSSGSEDEEDNSEEDLSDDNTDISGSEDEEQDETMMSPGEPEDDEVHDPLHGLNAVIKAVELLPEMEALAKQSAKEQFGIEGDMDLENHSATEVENVEKDTETNSTSPKNRNKERRPTSTTSTATVTTKTTTGEETTTSTRKRTSRYASNRSRLPQAFRKQTDERSNTTTTNNLTTNDEENLSPDTDILLLRCADVVRKYFLDRLITVLKQLGAESSLLDGWSIRLFRRRSGLLNGLVELLYDREGLSFRSRLDLASNYGLQPVLKKNMRSMTRSQFAMAACEFREKLLLSQQLSLHQFCCSEIRYENDLIVLLGGDELFNTQCLKVNESIVTSDVTTTNEEKEKETTNDIVDCKEENSVDAVSSDIGAKTTADDESLVSDVPVKVESETTLPSTDVPKKIAPLFLNGTECTSLDVVRDMLRDDSKNRVCFALGNTTVLQWGQVLPTEDSLHTESQIFPLGFQCLRQEHDCSLRRVVDCFCEIDALCTLTDETQVTYFTLISSGKTLMDVVQLKPLFRVTVEWVLDNGNRVVRVYEGSSPQQAWQGAMLEKIGTGDKNVFAAVANPWDDEKDVFSPEVDEEEYALRNQVRELRRSYFRLLREEQKKGQLEAVESRLEMDSVNNFFDDSLLHVVEGLAGVEHCEKYQFLDSREEEVGHKGLLRDLTVTQTKVRGLDSLIRSEAMVLAKRYKQATSRSRGGRRGSRSSSTAVTSSEGVVSTRTGRVVKRSRRAKKSDESDPSTVAARRAKDEAKQQRRRNRVELKAQLEAERAAREAARATRRTQEQAAREYRTLVQNANRARGTRLREIDRQITTLRNGKPRAITRRRDELRAIIEARAQGECQTLVDAAQDSKEPKDNESSSLDVSTKSKSSRPLPPSGVFLGHSEIVSVALELWENYHTLHPQDSPVRDLVPKIESFIRALTIFHPLRRQIGALTRGMDSHLHVTRQLAPLGTLVDGWSLLAQSPGGSECVSSINERWTVSELSRRTALRIMNGLCVSLSDNLVRGFESVMGIAALEDVRIPLNSLTWSELVRVSLLANLSRELGYNEADVTTTIKGRQSSSPQEASEKRILKLARRRLVATYANRADQYKTVVGFSSAAVARLPMPKSAVPEVVGHATSNSTAADGREIHSTATLWLRIINMLRTIGNAACKCNKPDSVNQLCQCLGSDGAGLWLVPDLISRAAAAAELFVVNSDTRALRNDLFKTISWPVSESSTARLEEARISAIQIADDYVSRILDADKVPSKSRSSIDRLNAKNLAYERCELAHTLATIASESEVPDMPFSKLRDWVSWQDSLLIASAEASEDVNQYGDSPGDENAENEMDISTTDDETTESDYARAKEQPTLIFRMWRVLLALMKNEQSKVFCDPVDREVFPAYFRTVRQPLCLQDIRSALLADPSSDEAIHSCSTNHGVGKVAAAYRDVQIILENAFLFNAEGSPPRVSAQRLTFVFERLFYEMVLNVDSPLISPSYCHGCRSEAPETAVICERCEAPYHLKCAGLAEKQKSDWYCQPCIEQHSVGHIHPLRKATVRHPDSVLGLIPAALSGTASDSTSQIDITEPIAGESITGNVVAIEQSRGSLVFTIDFHSTRENWPASKVAAYLVSSGSTTGDQVVQQLPPSSSILTPFLAENSSNDPKKRLDITSPSAALKASVGFPVDIDASEYNSVAVLARGYSGWGGSNLLIPSILSPQLSIKAAELFENDPIASADRHALAILSAFGTGKEIPMMDAGWAPNELSSDDWMDILRVLLRTVLPQMNASSMLPTGEEQDRLTSVWFQRIRQKPSQTAQSLPPSVPAKEEPTSAVKKSSCDDEDEEMDFDDNSKPIPSASAENSQPNTSAPQPATCPADDYNSRYVARLKGREDGLSSHSLVAEVLETVDITSISVDETPEIAAELGDATPAAMATIARACASRPTDGLPLDEWISALDAKTTCITAQSAMMTNVESDEKSDEKSDENSRMTCSLCGLDEIALCSPLVWGQDIESWEAQFSKCDELPECMYSLSMTDQSHNASVGESQAGVGAGDTTSSRRRPTRFREEGILFKPVDPKEAEVEVVEAQAANKILVCGSIPMHECCAQLLYAQRKLAYQNVSRDEEIRLVETLCGDGYPLRIPLGMDRNGVFFWRFAASNAIFASRNVENPEDRGPLTQSVITNKSAECTTPFLWTVYRSPQEIRDLEEWLSPSIPSESLLSRAIRALRTDIFDSYDVSLEDEGKIDGAEPLTATEWFVAGEKATALDVVHCRDPTKAVEEAEFARELSTELEALWEQRRAIHTFAVQIASEQKNPRFARGDRVFILANDSLLIWPATVEEVSRGDLSRNLYRVRFDQDWSTSTGSGTTAALFGAAAVMGWYPEAAVVSSKDTIVNPTDDAPIKLSEFAASAREWQAETTVRTIPPPLRSLLAFDFLSATTHGATALHLQGEDTSGASQGRESLAPTFQFSDQTNSLSLLRTAMLAVEAAIPKGAFDAEKWGQEDNGSQFSAIWRECVLTARDAVSLMQCQVLLEYGIRSQWLRAPGNKLLQSLPSRVHALRTASYPSIAMRIFALDGALAYDKVQEQPVNKRAGSSLNGNPSKKKK